MPPILPSLETPEEESQGSIVDDFNVNQMAAQQPSSSDTDEDEEFVGNGGYQILSQEPPSQVVHESVDEFFDLTHSTCSPSTTKVDVHPDMPKNEEGWASENWNTHLGISRAEPMNEEHANKIKSIMSGIVLPSASQPAWANLFPDQVWKQKLITELSTKKTGSN
ncbi:PREDICTED: male-enhanced antigen 1-like [Priapulus caudatus]|uniref:Male-enhanced antigen 1 n=1 Tax=Priapulus caudatus TaxID=37621 RepID=A0ABM1DZA4_PRICU|nr:PREDICTED: male-enhanced antigen 1-like [Priapulus caudatus]XP_014665276.1 PREDICTED: male-enhanced antigen 1-like [Priapulus caudatus]XP_014665277.1 PREDICTED: male-enhanced antigen 1-like [Priapulus caudatus]XP_014665278.1 PREDICTED: male-enhanced antigen 1-like [Priapulus caudatus]XP_014665280.1 PREDICTED: male-enhanced antigen 1-like [Priapulus caudatus]